MILEQASQQDMVDDLTQLMPLVILLCVGVICYCFRSLAIGACILSHVGFTIVCTVGTLGFFELAFNNISVIAPEIPSVWRFQICMSSIDIFYNSIIALS